MQAATLAIGHRARLQESETAKREQLRWPAGGSWPDKRPRLDADCKDSSEEYAEAAEEELTKHMESGPTWTDPSRGSHYMRGTVLLVQMISWQISG